ncbi:MAG TPA: hypothetical protein VK255_03315 [Patescibacteria group bacterium]|nr:hypothetical protein [Patescibacteria group bacterium]
MKRLFLEMTRLVALIVELTIWAMIVVLFFPSTNIVSLDNRLSARSVEIERPTKRRIMLPPQKKRITPIREKRKGIVPDY